VTSVERAAIRSADLLLSAFALWAMAPLAAVLAAEATLRFGSPFFTAPRLGRGGRGFTHVKLRTMSSGPSFGRSYLEAGRIAPFFRIARRLHVDEYPELILVLCGSMSMVGPRPLPRVVIDGCLARPSPDRFETKPGLFGLAQLKLAKEGFMSSATQFALDSAWARRGSLRLYLAVIAATIGPAIKARPGRPSPEAERYRASLGVAPSR
jgi:lipopolysaccharide/colanic/teichoic acid biosynthesis glycosyltransferase